MPRARPRVPVPRSPNVQYAAGMQLLRRSNAAGLHDPRPNRQRSRSDARRSAIRESQR